MGSEKLNWWSQFKIFISYFNFYVIAIQSHICQEELLGTCQDLKSFCYCEAN